MANTRHILLKLTPEVYKDLATEKMDYELDKEHTITWETFIKIMFDTAYGN